MVFRTQYGNKAAAATAQEVRKLLHLDPEATEFTVAFGSVAENDRQIAILTRSMLEILAEASAGVEIPRHDVDQRRVTKMAVPPGTPESSPRFIVRVHSSNSKPDSGETFTAVRCRDHWFWVDDNRPQRLKQKISAFHNHALGIDSVLGKRHKHWNSDA